MRKWARSYHLPILLAVTALAGCTPAPVGPGPQQVAEMYYQAVRSGDFKAAAELYTADTSTTAVIDQLESNRRHLGELQSYRMTDLISYPANGGTRYNLRFMTNYAGQHATEGLILFLSDNDNRVRIEEHQIH